MVNIIDKKPEEAAPDEPLSFKAVDVTATQTLDVSGVDRSIPVGSVARSLAARMGLPGNTPWALRDDRTGRILEDDRKIGDELESERIILTPKTHLGGAV